MKVERVLLGGFLADHPLDASRLFEQLPLDQTVAVLSEVPPLAAARTLSRLSADLAARCLENLPPSKAAETIEALPPGSATVFLRRVEKEKRAALLGGVAAHARERLQSLLSYPEESAGAVMDSLTATVPDDITVEEARRRLHEDSEHLYYYLYVVNREQRLVGVVGLRELFMADGESLVRTLMSPKVMSVSDRDPLAAVVAHPGWREHHAMPVVSEGGVFVGMIRYRTLRRLAEAHEQGREGMGFDTLFALGELYWTGLVELFGGISSGTRRRI